MITKRAAEDRGPSNHGWLDSKHSFSFAHYYDPNHMGFGPLRVINDDKVAAGAGFGTHPHRDMEIISYVLEGGLAHKDSMGNGSTIRHGEVQLMSAGTGVTHSEFNASKESPVHFLQIWIVPNKSRTQPEYHQKAFAFDNYPNQFIEVVAPAVRQGEALPVKQDAVLSVGHFEKGGALELELNSDRKYWLQVATGSLELNGFNAKQGDGFAYEGEHGLSVNNVAEHTELLLFDVPR